MHSNPNQTMVSKTQIIKDKKIGTRLTRRKYIKNGGILRDINLKKPLKKPRKKCVKLHKDKIKMVLRENVVMK